jgi:hypothetical protein
MFQRSHASQLDRRKVLDPNTRRRRTVSNTLRTRTESTLSGRTSLLSECILHGPRPLYDRCRQALQQDQGYVRSSVCVHQPTRRISHHISLDHSQVTYRCRSSLWEYLHQMSNVVTLRGQLRVLQWTSDDWLQKIDKGCTSLLSNPGEPQHNITGFETKLDSSSDSNKQTLGECTNFTSKLEQKQHTSGRFSSTSRGILGHPSQVFEIHPTLGDNHIRFDLLFER